MTFLKYLFFRFYSISQPSGNALASSSAVWAISVLLFCNIYFILRVLGEVFFKYNVFEKSTNLFIGLGLFVYASVVAIILSTFWSEFKLGYKDNRFRIDSGFERLFRIYVAISISSVAPFVAQSIILTFS